MPKIAILTVEKDYDSKIYGMVQKYITDWTEVSEEDYKLLIKYLRNSCPNTYIIVRNDNDYIPKYVKECIELAEKERVREITRKENDMKNKKRREEAQIKRKKLKLEKLQEELGVRILSSE